MIKRDPVIRKPASRYPFSILRERLQERGEEALDFAIGGGGHPLAEGLAELVHGQPQLALRRSTAAEVATFGERAAEMLGRVYGARVDPRQVLPVAAGRPAMSALATCLLHPGDRVLVTEPGYPAFAQVAEHQQAAVCRVALDPRREFLPDLEGVESLGSMRLAALNYPNNPTGAVLTSELVDELGRRLGPSAILFNDAAYGPLAYDARPRSLIGLHREQALEQPAVELHSLAKLFALGPLGISFLAGSEAVVEALRSYSEFAGAPLSSLQLQLAIRCVSEDEPLGSIRGLFAERVQGLRAVLAALGFEPYPTPAGLYVLCRLPASVAGRPVSTARQAADLLLDELGLAVVGWDAPPNGYLRFSSLYRRQDLDALAALASDGRLLGR